MNNSESVTSKKTDSPRQAGNYRKKDRTPRQSLALVNENPVIFMGAP